MTQNNISIFSQLVSYFSHANYEFVLLFGSYADNSFSERSDFDIGLYFKDEVDYLLLGYESAKLTEMLGKKWI